LVWGCTEHSPKDTTPIHNWYFFVTETHNNIASLKAVLWLRLLGAGLSLWGPGFSLRSVDVGFVVEKMAQNQVVIGVPQFPLLITFHRGKHVN
jgi:hypothetical protein